MASHSLPFIIAQARAGALEQAWRLFREGGYESATDDPAALAVKGRLLKDGALLASGAERRLRLIAAAEAYAAADALGPQPYLLINVATLSFLAGDRNRAVAIAGEVLQRLASGEAIAETPYWLAATRAEALLLRSDVLGADAALGEAIAQDPGGWSDHASTLRQFRLIFAASGLDSSWLDPHRPPRSLHFAGHLGVAEYGVDALRAKIDALLAEERIGFGYGALAAGADLVIAEALLAQGAELHVILPAPCDVFVAQSVRPYGSGWVAKFDACLAAATSISIATDVAGDYEPLATALAADLAMGEAVLNARRLESEAVQLLVVDGTPGPYGGGVSTARDGAIWEASGRVQHVVRWPRTGSVPASSARDAREGRPDRRLAALLHITFAGIDALDDAEFARALDEVVMPVRKRARAIGIEPQLTLPLGNARIMGFSSVESAWRYGAALLKPPAPALPLRIAGHYAIGHWLDDPPSIAGPAIVHLNRLAGAALSGSLTVSEQFAAALFIAADGDAHAELVGELDGRRLFALSPRNPIA